MDDVSPLPKPKQEAKVMSFYDALHEVVENKRRATRLSWNSNEEYIYIASDGEILIHTKGENDVTQVPHRWILQIADIEATDFCLLPEQS